MRKPSVHRVRGRRRLAVAALAGSVAVVGLGALALRSSNPKQHLDVRRNPTGIDATTVAGAAVTHSEIALAPSARIGASMAFDQVSGTVVLFGGLGPYGTLADTWAWNGSSWRELHPAAAASSRMTAAMTYDPASHEVLMLGGTSLVPLTEPCTRPAVGAPVCHPVPEERDVSPGADLWGWDGHSWHLRLPANVSPHPAGGMVTQADGRVLVLGANGTWAYDGSAWTQRAGKDSQLFDPVGVAVDPASHDVIAVERFQPGICMPHSGCTAPAYMRTFVWTGSAWKDVADRGTPATGGVARGQLVPDPAGGGLLMIADDHSTWRRTGGQWRQVAAAAQSPTSLQGMSLVADPVHHEVVAFGGEPTPTNVRAFDPTNDTWTWNGEHWHEFRAPSTPTPVPPPIAPVDCGLNGPSLGGSQQAAGGGAVRIVGSNIFGLSPCRLRATFTLTLRDTAGRPLAADGNPSTVSVDTETTKGAGAVTITWTWNGGCAAGPVRAELAASGAGAFPTPFPVDLDPLPRCSRGTSGQLEVAPYKVT